MDLKPTDLILRMRTDLGFTRDRHIKYASRLQPTCGAPSRPHSDGMGDLIGTSFPGLCRRAADYVTFLDMEGILRLGWADTRGCERSPQTGRATLFARSYDDQSMSLAHNRCRHRS